MEMKRWSVLNFGSMFLACALTLAASSLVADDARLAVMLPEGGEGVLLDSFVTMRGEPVEISTEVRASWDDLGLTFVFDCEDDDVRAEERARNDTDIWRDDTVEVFLSVGNVRSLQSRNWLHVILNAAGSVYDERGPIQYLPTGDPGWGSRRWSVPGMRTDVERTPNGWHAEIFMPWEGLGGKPSTGETWGFNLNRTVWPQGKYLCISPTHGSFYFIGNWAELVFGDAREDGERIEPEPAVVVPADGIEAVEAPKDGEGVRIKPFVNHYGDPADFLARTEARVRWDEDALHIVFECHDLDIRSEERKRDDSAIWRDDTVEIFLDLGRDGEINVERNLIGENWFHIIVNASGSVFDERGPMQFSAAGEFMHGDTSWELPGLQASIEPFESGWRAKISIPWQGLGVEPEPGMEFGFNLCRTNWNSTHEPEEEMQALSPTHGYFYNIGKWAVLRLIDP